MPTRSINHYKNIPGVLNTLETVHEAIDAVGFERPLHHLVQLRASQINGCGHCVKMHVREARQDGETDDRLDRLVVWRQVSDFSAKERAALALTEALTTLDRVTELYGLREDAREHFSEVEISALITTIAMINLWNRIQISAH